MRRVAGSSLLAVLLTLVPDAAPRAEAIGGSQTVACRAAKRTCWPTGFAFSPDGSTLFYIERFTGHVRAVTLSSGADERWARVRVDGRSGEQGLLGIAVDPQWPAEQRVYVYVTKGSPLRNRILRLTKQPDGSVTSARLLSIPASQFHNGGTIHFGPDGMLWAVTGDSQEPARAQRKRSLAGKVLRLTEDGTAAPGNPGGRRWWTRGHRNSFGFAFDPVDGSAWQTENGPECNDELNRLLPGRNFGWGPASSCPGTNASGRRPVRPRVKINPVIAPTGAAFCQGCGLGASTEGTLLVGSYNDRRVRRYTLSADRARVVAKARIYRHVRPILAVEAAPDGIIYFSDRRGIYRLVP